MLTNQHFLKKMISEPAVDPDSYRECEPRCSG